MSDIDTNETHIRTAWNEAAAWQERPLLVTLVRAVTRWLTRKAK